MSTNDIDWVAEARADLKGAFRNATNLDDARDAEAWRTRCKLAVWSAKTDVEITSDLLALFDAVDVAETVEDYAAAERAVQVALTAIAAQAGERK